MNYSFFSLKIYIFRKKADIKELSEIKRNKEPSRDSIKTAIFNFAEKIQNIILKSHVT